MSIPLEERITQITIDGKTHPAEVRQFEERVSLTAWVPSIQQTVTLPYANDAGRPGVYENENGDTATYTFKSWNQGDKFVRIKVPKTTKTA